MIILGFKWWKWLILFLFLFLVGFLIWFFFFKSSAPKPEIKPDLSIPSGQRSLPPVVVDPTFGTIKDARLQVVFLTGPNGMTLYTDSKDVNEVSSCFGDCAKTWPPYVVDVPADIHIPTIVKGEVGTTKRGDGKLQVTYNGMPLYYYSKDKRPGDTTGQKVGGVWFVAKL